MIDLDHEALLGHLSARGVVSSRDLQRASGKSQATVSRLLSDLSDRVVSLGRARSTRYGLAHPIRGLPAQQPIFWTDEAGTPAPVGVLTFLHRDLIHIDSPYAPSGVSNGLPWFLQPLKAQGFLGKVHASRLAAAGLAADPTRWDLESALFAALQLDDPPGALTLGTAAAGGSPGAALADDASLPAQLDRRSADVAAYLPAGSSAAGEQPKFLAAMHDGRHVLVKFTPPRGTPFGERWHDLLHAEHLALDVLAQHGVAVAPSRIVESAQRTYLVSERFDRLGRRGRRHVVTIGDVHAAYVPGSYGNWQASALALARQGRLQALEAAQISALLEFGRLIGNTDMHSGNLALIVTLQGLARGRFSLAPVYDMLPMRWRPDPTRGDWDDYTAFEPDARSLGGPASGPAAVFWERLEAHAAASRQLRAVAGAMQRRLRG